MKETNNKRAVLYSSEIIDSIDEGRTKENITWLVAGSFLIGSCFLIFIFGLVAEYVLYG